MTKRPVTERPVADRHSAERAGADRVHADHPSSDHPSSDHPNSEHPNSEHPSSEHAGNARALSSCPATDRLRPVRMLLAALAGAALLALLLLVYAAPGRGLGWSATTEVDLPARQWTPVSGTVGPVGADGSLLLGVASGSDAAVIAADIDPQTHPLRFLDYRFEDFPRALRVALGWRSAAQPGHWQWAVLPFPDGHVTVDLARLVPHWSADPLALRIALSPAELLPLDSPLQASTRLVGVRLRGDAYAPAVAALLDEWAAYQPWSGRSINTGGFDLRQQAPRPLQAFALLAAVALVLVPGLALGWRRAQWLRAAALAACALWVLLDLAQLRTLSLRAAHGAELAQLAPRGLQVDPATDAALQALAGVPALADPRRPLAVLGANPFLRSYPVFALQPRNAAAIAPDAVAQLPEGSLLLRLGEVGVLDAGAGVLAVDGTRRGVRIVHADGAIALLQLDADAAPR